MRNVRAIGGGARGLASLRVAVAAVTALATLWLAVPAFAAFPGANGLLAVQPLRGGGIVLVSPTGRFVNRICTHKCGTPRRPRWSPDGGELVFAGPAIKIVYSDGSCLNCQFGRAPNPSFKPVGTVISFIAAGLVTLDKIDGNREVSRPATRASDAVWSATGALAVVRGGTIWAGRSRRLRRIAAGTEPSWSPSGTALAAEQRGWIVVISVRDGRVRRIARGGAPAFSPDGHWIAYIAPDHQLMIVRVAGGHPKPRRLSNIRAASVDWQPRPRRAHRGCAAPPGSTVLASSSAAVVTGDGLPLPALDFGNASPIAYMGCLRNDGRERLLERFTGNNVDNASFVRSAVLAAPYAGLVLTTEDVHYGGESDALQVFDLRTGRATALGGENAGCPGFSYGPCNGLEDVVLGSDGVSAARSRIVYPTGSLSQALVGVSCAPGASTCVTVDNDGHIFSSTNPGGGAGAWSVTTLSQELLGPSAIDCPSSSLCVGSGPGIFTSTNPTGGPAAWKTTQLPGTPSYVNRVRCPSQNLCVGVRDDGSVATSTDPTGGTSAWSISDIDANHPLNAIFCSARPQCFVNDASGKVFTSSNPAGGVSAWSPSPPTPSFEAGSCPTSNLCIAVNGRDISTSIDPGAGAWTTKTVSDDLSDITCPSSSLCVAVGAGGALDTSTDPAAGTWAHSTIDSSRRLDAVSCPTPSSCVAVDATGHVVSTTDPTGGPSAWTPSLIDGDPCNDTTPCSVEEIQVSDGSGRRTVDSSKISGNGPFLTGLNFAGDVLSWSHAGAPRSVTLTRPAPSP